MFGCYGSTDVVVDAIEWAVDNDMDVINMSLGSRYGTADSADAIASDNAAKAGVVVVASAGNSGDLRYITGSPGVEHPYASPWPRPRRRRSIRSAILGAAARRRGSGARASPAINANGADFDQPVERYS